MTDQGAVKTHFSLKDYEGISPKIDLLTIHKLADRLSGKRFLHVNSTKSGGGVAEILHRMTSILKGLGIGAEWEALEGDARFFDITKKIHNALQGRDETVSEEMWEYYHEVNRKNFERIDLDAEIVFIHDPQPAPQIEFRKKGRWVWRCHIDVSNPVPAVWDHLARYCEKYDAAVFSVSKFATRLAVDKFIISPAIAPLSDKNRDLGEGETASVIEKLGLPADRPMILQVSRFDRFKDPVGVIESYRLVKKYNDCVLVLAGSPATDDPEGDAVLNEVRKAASEDPDIFIFQLPAFSDIEINALQRAAHVVVQKSLREGFGLTVSEAMWKGKPVVGGAVGGIPLQIIHGVNGFLVHSVEGAAFRIRQLLNNPEMAGAMGQRAKEHVGRNFLITRQIRDYLSVCHIIEKQGRSVIELP